MAQKRAKQDPATVALDRMERLAGDLEVVRVAAYSAWCAGPRLDDADYQVAGRAWQVANEAWFVARIAVGRLRAPQARLSALLTCENPTVRAAAAAVIETPTTREPVVQRAIAALDRTARNARAAERAATDKYYAATEEGEGDVAEATAADWAALEAWKRSLGDFGAARKCLTLADLLTCGRPAVRLAAQFALAPTPEPTPPAPPAPQRKRKR
jgi:hypothetical protein